MNFSTNTEDRYKKYSPILQYAGLALMIILYAVIAYRSYGYDDEIFNVHHVEEASSVADIFRKMNQVDIHPPVSYVINYILYSWTSNWHLVRMIGAIAVAIVLWIYRHIVFKNDSLCAQLVSWCMICFNPTVLLWCTGIRWYTYMIILSCVLGILIYKYANTETTFPWPAYFTVCVLMFYTEYSSAILIISSFISLLLCYKKELLKHWKILLISGAAAVALVIPQCIVFFQVHLPNGGHEIKTISNTILYTGEHLLCGQALIPVSVPGIMMTLSSVLLFCAFLKNWKTVLINPSHRTFVLGVIGLIVSRIGGKMRNFVPLTPLQGKMWGDLAGTFRNKYLRIATAGLLTAATFCGIWNVAYHQDTTKSSWNYPYKEVIDAISENCIDDKETLIVSHNPVLDYYLADMGYHVVNLFDDKDWKDQLADHGNQPVIFIKGFRGALPAEDWEYLSASIAQRGYSDSILIGLDHFAWFKRIMDPENPDYYAELYVPDH